MLVGLDGNIASGKSTVAKIFKSMGACVIDADEISKAFLSRISIQSKEKLLGALEVSENEIYSDGFIDRKKLGNLVFSNPGKKLALEKLLHPLISTHVKDSISYLNSQGYKIIVYEAALLVETGRYKEMDRLVVVTADDDVRLARLMKRNSLTQSEAEIRIKSQLSQEEKVKVANFVINNSGTESELEAAAKVTFKLIEALI